MEKLHTCQFNRMVDCGYGGGQCGRCGWNPEVYEKRLLKRMEKMRKEEETEYAKTGDHP